MSNPTSYTDAALNYNNVHYNDFHQPYEASLSDEESTDSNNDRHTAKVITRDCHDPEVYEKDGLDEEELNQSTILMTSFNVINSIIGSGIVGMPYALHKAGYGLGIMLLIVVSIATVLLLVPFFPLSDFE